MTRRRRKRRRIIGSFTGAVLRTVRMPMATRQMCMRGLGKLCTQI
jgi:hypothetical protein